MGILEAIFRDIFGMMFWGVVNILEAFWFELLNFTLLNKLLFWEVYYFFVTVAFPKIFEVWFVLLKMKGWAGSTFYIYVFLVYWGKEKIGWGV